MYERAAEELAKTIASAPIFNKFSTIRCLNHISKISLIYWLMYQQLHDQLIQEVPPKPLGSGFRNNQDIRTIQRFSSH